ncbi:hypothetical protein SCH4B_0151 [Ruegeria sp. TrichCH4B]|nr:hypothetical protein SCH4B_0151 [Ruegeria sp. TrichCH4B]
MPIAAKAGEEPTLPNAAPRSNRSEAQIATFAKSGPDREHGRANGPNLPFAKITNAAARLRIADVHTQRSIR